MSVTINRVLLQPVEKSIQMYSSACGDVSTNELIGVAQIRHELFCRQFPRKPYYVIDGKCRFVTSTSGMARILYSSWVSLIILMRRLSFLAVNFPYIEMMQRFPRPCLAAFVLIDSPSSRIPSLLQNDSIIVLCRRGFDPRWSSRSPRL